ncbi:hypothetical protein LLH03_16960 [bacterium]|nr:hypothetical protein [bacterium]
MPFRATAQDIAALPPPDFVDFMAHLLRCESERLGMPPESVICPASTVMTVPDGGVDALAEGAPAGANSRLPLVRSVWQFKAGAIKPHQLTDELDKPDVTAELQAGSCWCLATGVALNIRTRQNRKAAADQWFQAHGLPPNYRILDGGELAEWAEQFPTVAMLPVFRRPRAGGLHTLEEWRRVPEHEATFYPDEQREEDVKQIRQWLACPSQHGMVRIEGPAGVGKTRLAMEAVLGSVWEERVLYCPNPGAAGLGDILQWVRAHRSATLALVVDECDQHTMQNMALYVSSTPERLKVLTIGTDPTSMYTTANPPGLLTLTLLADDAMRKLLSESFRDLAPSGRERVIHLSGGYVKLAVNLARAIRRLGNQARSASELARVQDIQDPLAALIPDREDRRAVEALSLLQRVGVRGDVAEEGRVLACFMGIDLHALLDAPHNPNSRPFVADAGRYRYVTPRLLAVWLANEVWTRRSDEVPELLQRLPTPESRLSLLQRVLDMGSEGVAEAFTRQLLGPSGPFRNLAALSDPELAQIVQVLVQLHPVEGVSALQRVLEHVPRDQLLQFTQGRRQVVHALQCAAWHPEVFFTAAGLLLRLAEAENEVWDNNASGAWTSLFLTHLGGTSVRAVDRHALLREALGGSVPSRLLAVRAVAAALQTHEVGDVSGEVQGGMSVPPRWRPESWSEEWEARRSALVILDTAIDDQNPEVQRAATEVLLDSWAGLARMGLSGDVVDRLERHRLDDERDRARLRDEISRLLQHDRREMPTDLAELLEALSERLQGSTFAERIRRWTGPSSYHEMSSQEGREHIQQQLAQLADEAMGHPDQLDLDWLASLEAVQAEPLGVLIGERDTSLVWLPVARGEVNGARAIRFASGYLRGVANRRGLDWLEDKMDEWAVDREMPDDALLDVLTAFGLTERALLRLIRMREQGRLLVREGRFLPPAWALDTPQPLLVALIAEVLLQVEPPAANAALELLTHALHKGDFDVSQAEKVVWTALERASAQAGKSTMSEFYWGEVAKRLVPLDPSRVASACMTVATDGDVDLYRENPVCAALIAATQAESGQVWEAVARRLAPEERSLRLLLSLRGWYGEYVGADRLVAWAEANLPDGPGVAASVAPVGDGPLIDPARALLLRFGPECVGDALEANFVSGVFGGPLSEFYEGKLRVVEEWCTEAAPAIQSWAAQVRCHLRARLDAARQEDAEDEV